MGIWRQVDFNGCLSGATLIADGTSDLPILFTSDAAVKSPGDWDFIGFYDGSSKTSSMQYCTVEYGGGYSSNYGEIYVAESAISMSNSVVRYSESHGISLDDEGYSADFMSNTIDEAWGISLDDSASPVLGNNTFSINALGDTN